MNLNLELIQSFNMPQKPYRPDWDDVGYEFTLPCGLPLTGFYQLNNSPCEMTALEGVDGYLYVDSRSELAALMDMSAEDILNFIKHRHPEFDLDAWL